MPRLSFFVFNILVATGPLWFTKYKGRTSFKTFRLFLIGFPSGSVQWSQQSDFIKYFLSLPLPAGVLFTAQEARYPPNVPTAGHTVKYSSWWISLLMHSKATSFTPVWKFSEPKLYDGAPYFLTVSHIITYDRHLTTDQAVNTVQDK